MRLPFCSYALLSQSTLQTVSSLDARQLLHAAARVRRMVASYARGFECCACWLCAEGLPCGDPCRGLVLDVLAKPSDLVSSALRSPSVAPKMHYNISQGGSVVFRNPD